MYDAAARPVFSQNAKQALEGLYTFNIYDAENRLTETGEAQLGCPYFDAYFSAEIASAPACSYHYSATGGGWLISPDPYIVANVDKVPYADVVHFIRMSNRHDVVTSIYDTSVIRFDSVGMDVQENLRRRVSCVKYLLYAGVGDSSYAYYDYATHYSYDAQGNVQTLVHDNPKLADVKRRYIRVDYDYDLISGKVNMLSYNRGYSDQFYQRYSYDADNRLTAVETSRDGYIWTKDAKYTYYDHGPLARAEIGDNNVQGVDYAYTIQGWLKVMNTDSLESTMDIGKDGSTTSITAKDAVAHAIDYFDGDYHSIGSVPVQHVSAPLRNLYNGNIARQTVAIDTFIKLNKQYVYDQLNRLIRADYATVSPAGALAAIPDYANRYTYDKDGNLQTLLRYGNNTPGGVSVMDELHYAYVGSTDKIEEVYDSAANVYTNDFLHYSGPATRYDYDAIGNLTKDQANGQNTIMWNLYNKVWQAISDSGTLRFDYDGAGNRVAKHRITLDPLGLTTISNDEYYVRDAQGNILATYKGMRTFAQPTTGYVEHSLTEHDIYGSSRLGIKQYFGREVGMKIDPGSLTYDTTRLFEHQPWYSLEYQDVIAPDSLELRGHSYDLPGFAKHVTGQIQYELSDHLGNVLATVSDKRLGASFAPLSGAFMFPGDPVWVQSWKPVVASAVDYYPFGQYMPGRYIMDSSAHCITTTVNHLDPQIGYRYLDGGTAGATTTAFGQATFSMPGTALVVNSAGGTPGSGGVSPTDSWVEYPMKQCAVNGATVKVDIPSVTSIPTFMFWRLSVIDSATGSTIGSSSISSAGAYPGFVITPITTPHSSCMILRVEFVTVGTTTVPMSSLVIQKIGIPVDTLVAVNVTANVCNNDFYRYGYNGQMKVNEWAGVGNHYDYGARNYDSRIARFISADPAYYKFPSISPYSYAANNPIFFVDIDGEEPTAAAYRAAAAALGIPVAKLRTIYLTETGGKAYFKDGKLKILFERHYFSQATRGKFDKTNPDISNPIQGGYGKYSEQYPKLYRAISIDEEAAYYSVSYTGFQIMGKYFKELGYKSAKEFGEAMFNGSENVHLDALVSYLKNVNPQLIGYLKNNDWVNFARGYNGPSYYKNNYDVKMKTNYESLEQNPFGGLEDGTQNTAPGAATGTGNTVDGGTAGEPSFDAGTTPYEGAYGSTPAPRCESDPH
jgi:RHS repeat-associated protein